MKHILYFLDARNCSKIDLFSARSDIYVVKFDLFVFIEGIIFQKVHSEAIQRRNNLKLCTSKGFPLRACYRRLKQFGGYSDVILTPPNNRGAEFWVTCRWLVFLSSFSHLPVFQNKRPWCLMAAYVTAGWSQIFGKSFLRRPQGPREQFSPNLFWKSHVTSPGSQSFNCLARGAAS